VVWSIFLLVVVVVVAVFIWDFRRKAARREAASRERYERIFQNKTRPAPDSVADPIPGVVAAPPSSSPPEPYPNRVRERFLGRAESLVYYLLKAGLPEHEVFANVSLATVVGATGEGAERELQLRRLSLHTLDFVVCDKTMRIVAVVEVEKPAAEDLPRRFRADTLKAAGVCRVSINPAALPARDAIRGLIAGA
jgi:Protein of unknown function (DUF2726)